MHKNEFYLLSLVQILWLTIFFRNFDNKNLITIKKDTHYYTMLLHLNHSKYLLIYYYILNNKS